MSITVEPEIDTESQYIYKLKSFIKIQLSKYFENKIFNIKNLISKNVDFQYIIQKAIAWELLYGSRIKLTGELANLDDEVLNLIVGNMGWVPTIFYNIETVTRVRYAPIISGVIKNLINRFFNFGKNQIEQQDIDEFNLATSVSSMEILPDLFVDPDPRQVEIWKKAIDVLRKAEYLSDIIKRSIPEWNLIIKRHHGLAEKLRESLGNIYYLLLALVVNSFIVGKSDVYLPYLLTLETEETVIIWPKMRVKKRILYELSQLTTHRGYINKYYGRHFGVFTGYIFGLFAYLIRRDIHADDDYPYYENYGLTSRYLKLVLFYLGAIDPNLWNTLQTEKKELPTVYKKFIEPVGLTEREIENTKEMDKLFRAWVQKVDIYEDVIGRVKNYLNSFIETIDFIPMDFEEKSFIYSNIRSQIGKAFRRMTKDLLENEEVDRIYVSKKFHHPNVDPREYDKMTLFLKYLYFNDKTQKIDIPRTHTYWRFKDKWWYRLGEGESIEDISVKVPKTKSEILDEMIEGIHFYDLYRMASELLFFMESLYDYSEKPKRYYIKILIFKNLKGLLLTRRKDIILALGSLICHRLLKIGC